MSTRHDRYDKDADDARGRHRSPSSERRYKDDRLRNRGDDERDRRSLERRRPGKDDRDAPRSRSPRRGRSRSRSPKRRDSVSRSPDQRSRRGREKRRHSRSASRSRSRSPSQSSTSSDHHRKKKKKDKHKRRSSRSRERRERKKEKKEKKKKKGSAQSFEWGKYGIISETDLYNKDQEFRTWLVEERLINPETLSKDQTKKEFAKFVEDYNTATLPHEKYYNMEVFDRRMNALRAGEYLPPTDVYDPNADMQAHASRHKKKDVERESYLSKEQLQELRRVQNERVEIGRMKRLGMDVKQNVGVRMEFDA